MKETLDKSDDLPKDELIESLHKAKLDYDHVLKFASKTYNDLVIGNDSGLKKDQIGPFFRCDKLGHLARICPNKTGNNNLQVEYHPTAEPLVWRSQIPRPKVQIYCWNQEYDVCIMMTWLRNLRLMQGLLSFSAGFTVRYFVLTYFFKVFDLIRNECFHLSTIFNNMGLFSLFQSALTLLIMWLLLPCGFPDPRRKLPQLTLPIQEWTVMIDVHTNGILRKHWHLKWNNFARFPSSLLMRITDLFVVEHRKLLPITTALIRTHMLLYLILHLIVSYKAKTAAFNLTSVVSTQNSYLSAA